MTDTKPAVRDHDFTRLYWGRSFNVRISERRVGLLRKTKVFLNGTCHATPGPRVGDTARWSTGSGVARGRFTKVEGFRDPMDMYSIEIEVLGLIDG